MNVSENGKINKWSQKPNAPSICNVNNVYEMISSITLDVLLVYFQNKITRTHWAVEIFRYQWNSRDRHTLSSYVSAQKNLIKSFWILMRTTALSFASRILEFFHWDHRARIHLHCHRMKIIETIEENGNFIHLMRLIRLKLKGNLFFISFFAKLFRRQLLRSDQWRMK